MVDSLQHQLRDFLTLFGDSKRLLVGYSGGLDSTVLLHLLSELKRQGWEDRPLLAIHINHQMSESSDVWQAHCQSVCRRLGVPLQVSRVTVTNQGGGLEREAREQRYRVFEAAIQTEDALLLAHHQDDQAETLLLRLMRGAGPKGLASMDVSRPLGQGTLLRPLLHMRRSQLSEWAQSAGIAWVDDESNDSLDFDRNYLRHQVMPLLEQRWPGYAERWQQSAELCRQSEQQLKQQAVEDLAASMFRPERWGWSLDLTVLRQLSVFRRGNVIREALAQLHLSPPDHAHLQQIEAQLVRPRDDAQGDVSWADVSFRTFRQRMYVLPSESSVEAPPTHIRWDLAAPLAWEGGVMRSCASDLGGLLLPRGSVLNVSTRKSGDRCRPYGRGHSQTLKKLFQEYGLEPWLRDRVPVLRLNEQIVAVGDLWVCHDFYRASGETIRLEWQRTAV